MFWVASHFLRAIGLTLAFHRDFAHCAFELARPARCFWAFVGTAAMQKGPISWAGHHISHHTYADRDGDPHRPAVSGFNNALTAFFAVGEGWHNIHHRYQRAARTGCYWWEFDPTYSVVAVMAWLGLAWNLQAVPARIYDEARRRARVT